MSSFASSRRAMGYPVQLTPSSSSLALVAGGGAIALQKIEGLIAAGIRVHVIAREVSPEIAAIASSLDCIELRDVRDGDVIDKAMVIAATDDRSVNASLARAARARGILVNAVDDPEASTFFAPAVVRR